VSQESHKSITRVLQEESYESVVYNACMRGKGSTVLLHEERVERRSQWVVKGDYRKQNVDFLDATAGAPLDLFINWDSEFIFCALLDVKICRGCRVSKISGVVDGHLQRLIHAPCRSHRGK
jgi:hypothetical protein